MGREREDGHVYFVGGLVGKTKRCYFSQTLTTDTFGQSQPFQASTFFRRR